MPPIAASSRWIEVSLGEQQLWLRDATQTLLCVPVSTARNGPGEQLGSECTPRGWHGIRARIGTACPANTVFVGRRPSGERYTPALRQAYPQRDWILTRILWLSGLEVGRNRLGSCDTLRRYIYIHGCPDEDILGVPGSHGCVKLRNTDIMRLCDLVSVQTRVFIHE